MDFLDRIIVLMVTPLSNTINGVTRNLSSNTQGKDNSCQSRENQVSMPQTVAPDTRKCITCW